MEPLKQAVEFFYQNFQVCSNIANIIFIAIPGLILIITIVKAFLNRQKHKKYLCQCKENGTRPGPAIISKYYLNQSYLLCIAILCVYTELRTLEAFYYQTKLEQIKTIENQELKLREKLWEVEKQTLELEIKKLQEQLTKQQLQEKIGEKTQK